MSVRLFWFRLCDLAGSSRFPFPLSFSAFIPGRLVIPLHRLSTTLRNTTTFSYIQPNKKTFSVQTCDTTSQPHPCATPRPSVHPAHPSISCSSRPAKPLHSLSVTLRNTVHRYIQPRLFCPPASPCSADDMPSWTSPKTFFIISKTVLSSSIHLMIEGIHRLFSKQPQIPQKTQG